MINTDSVKFEKTKATPKARSALNKRLPRMGRVVFSENSSAVHCAVKGFSEDKAILTMTGWMGLPAEFTLYVEPDSVRAQCKVISRKGSNVEVRFTEVEHGVRYRSAG